MKKIYFLVLYVFFAMLIYRLPRWFDSNFGFVTLDQVLYHIDANVGDGIPSGMIRSAIREFIIKPFAVALVVYFILRYLRFNQWSKKIFLFFFVASTALLMAGGTRAFNDLEIMDFMGERNQTDWMKDINVPPKLVEPLSHKNDIKNLVFVYVESLENRYVDPGSLLAKTAKNNINANHFPTMPGSQWTIAGIVSSQCGVPLMPVGLIGNNNLEGTVDKPLESAICLGDLLKDQGYHVTFMGGAQKKFAGKGPFLDAHGYQETFGLDEIRAAHPYIEVPKDWWGISDSDLFILAKDKINQLHAKQEPFVFNMLTVDTHAPNGNLSKWCEERGYTDNIKSIFDCTVAQLDEFILWFDEQPVAKDTVLVIMGDHPFMGKVKMENQDKSMFFMLKSPVASTPSKSLVMTHFDVPSTLLHAMGFQLDSGRMGLGEQLMTQNNSFLLSRYSEEALVKMMRRPSESYLTLWKPKLRQIP